MSPTRRREQCVSNVDKISDVTLIFFTQNLKKKKVGDIFIKARAKHFNLVRHYGVRINPLNPKLGYIRVPTFFVFSPSVFSQGEEGTSWYIILKGSVNVVIYGKVGISPDESTLSKSLKADQYVVLHRVLFALFMKEMTLESSLLLTTPPVLPPLSCERTTVTS